MRRTALVTLSVAAVLGLAACESTGGQVDKPEAIENVAAEAAKDGPEALKSAGVEALEAAKKKVADEAAAKEAADKAAADAKAAADKAAADKAAAEAAAAAAADDGLAEVGVDGYTWEDGLKVQITKLEKYTPDDTAAGHTAGNIGVVATVTITNGTGKVFDTALTMLQSKSGPAGTQNDTIFDSANNIGAFEGSVAPGRNATAKVAFSVPPAEANDLIIEVTPSFEYDAALFKGAA